MNKPSHIAYVVSDSSGGEGKAIWTRVGSVWPHKDGVGFDVSFPDGVAVSGRIVCTVPKERPEQK